MSAIKKIIGKLLMTLLDPIANVLEHLRVHKAVSKINFSTMSYYIKGPVSIVGQKNITIGKNFRAGIHFRLEAIDSYAGDSFSPEITIGDNVSFQDFCHVGCIERVTIGDGTMVASRVFISDHNHGYIDERDLVFRPESRPLSHKPVSIGKNVWIGEGVCILPGVSIGDNVIIGANSVVTHNFSDNSVIAGVPARLIKLL